MPRSQIALKRLRGHRRAPADAAVENHRPLAVDGWGLRGEIVQLDVARARDVAGLALVGLAHVDHLGRADPRATRTSSTRPPDRCYRHLGRGRRSERSVRGIAEHDALIARIQQHMQAVSDVYTIPQENLDFCATIGQIAREKIAPRSAEIDEQAEYPWDIRKLLAEQDILGLPFRGEYGGIGTGTLMLNMAVEEIAKVDAACALILMVQELGTLPIQLFGSDELEGALPAEVRHRRVLARVRPVRARGRLGPRRDEDDRRHRRRRVGHQRHQELDHQPRVADFYITFAVTDREIQRITAFVVEADRPGFSVGKLEHKLGIRASPTGQPIFEDVRVPARRT